MSREHRIDLVGGKADDFGTLTAEQQGELCHLSFLVQERRYESSDYDFFEAFCQIRRQLEADGWMPSCYAASLNVYPSGMSRQMAGGTVAYLLTMGKQSDARVRIFDTGPDVIPASVDDQKSFYLEWLASLEFHPNLPRASA